MGTIWVKEFTGGLDTRRLPVTTTGGVLIRANNGHINRGGEFEKRAAFVKLWTASSTVGLAAGDDGVYTFGHTARPGALPADVKYQRLQHPTASGTAISKIMSVEQYAGKLYVAVEFANGDRFLYYDGDYVDSWSDEYARGTITIEQNEITPAEPGSGSFRILPGDLSMTSKITKLNVGGEKLINADITHSGDVDQHGDFLDDIVDAVNARTGTTGFTASRKSWIITVTGPDGTEFNGESIEITVTGTLTVEDKTKITGGSEEVVPTLQQLWVGNQRLLDDVVEWTDDAAAMADDVRDAINAFTATSDYSATSSNRKVIIRSEVAGREPNGSVITIKAKNGFALEDKTRMSGGSNDALPRGTFLKTADSKVYAVAGKALYFSGIAEPTEWTTDNIGAGFIDMGAKTAQGEQLTALSRYQSYMAIFAKRTIIIEYIDPDPELYRVVQTLRNTGTRFANSVTEFGDSDVFYADESGLRSLQSRVSTNSAATTDIGVPVDPLISEKLANISTANAYKVCGLIEPKTGNFWLAIEDVIYVFSRYPGAKINAWTTYTPSRFNGNGAEVEFDIEYVAVYDRQVYVRAGDDIMVFGGEDYDAPTYDGTEAVAWLPYMDANRPTQKKNWQSIDLAIDGEWTLAFAMDPNNEAAEDGSIVIPYTTYGLDKIPNDGQATHLSLRLSTTDDKAAKLSSLVMTFDGNNDEDS